MIPEHWTKRDSSPPDLSRMRSPTDDMAESRSANALVLFGNTSLIKMNSIVVANPLDWWKTHLIEFPKLAKLRGGFSAS